MAVALGLTGAHDGADLTVGSLRLMKDAELAPEGRKKAAARVCHGPRVGVSGPGGDGELFPWRFWFDADPTVSIYRPAKR